MKYLLLFCCCIQFGLLSAQVNPTSITLEDLWTNYTFSPRSVPGFNFQLDGQHYTRKENNKIVQYDLLTGKQTKVLLDAATLSGDVDFSKTFSRYQFSGNENHILLSSELESIYRHSTKGNFFVYDSKLKKIRCIY